jgi:hypothetical protein
MQKIGIAYSLPTNLLKIRLGSGEVLRLFGLWGMV